MRFLGQCPGYRPEDQRPFRAKTGLREIEVEGVEKLDRGIRRVHLDIARGVDQRLRVVEESLHIRPHRASAASWALSAGTAITPAMMFRSRQIAAAASTELTLMLPTRSPTFSQGDPRQRGRCCAAPTCEGSS